LPITSFGYQGVVGNGRDLIAAKTLTGGQDRGRQNLSSVEYAMNVEINVSEVIELFKEISLAPKMSFKMNEVEYPQACR
jgi:hypothetical protein